MKCKSICLSLLLEQSRAPFASPLGLPRNPSLAPCRARVLTAERAPCHRKMGLGDKGAKLQSREGVDLSLQLGVLRMELFLEASVQYSRPRMFSLVFICGGCVD